jgi:hypothetical protein
MSQHLRQVEGQRVSSLRPWLRKEQQTQQQEQVQQQHPPLQQQQPQQQQELAKQVVKKPEDQQVSARGPIQFQSQFQMPNIFIFYHLAPSKLSILYLLSFFCIR